MRKYKLDIPFASTALGFYRLVDKTHPQFSSLLCKFLKSPKGLSGISVRFLSPDILTINLFVNISYPNCMCFALISGKDTLFAFIDNLTLSYIQILHHCMVHHYSKWRKTEGLGDTYFLESKNEDVL